MLRLIARLRATTKLARRPLISDHDPDVDRAVQAVQNAPGDAPLNIVRAVYQAVYSYKRTGDRRVLTQLADDLVATARLESSPTYQKTLAAAYNSPTKPGRSINEIFGGYR